MCRGRFPPGLRGRREVGYAGGLISWPIKFVIRPAFVMLALQGVPRWVIKRIAALRGEVTIDAKYERTTARLDAADHAAMMSAACDRDADGIRYGVPRPGGRGFHWISRDPPWILRPELRPAGYRARVFGRVLVPTTDARDPFFTFRGAISNAAGLPRTCWIRMGRCSGRDRGRPRLLVGDPGRIIIAPERRLAAQVIAWR